MKIEHLLKILKRFNYEDEVCLDNITLNKNNKPDFQKVEQVEKLEFDTGNLIIIK